MKKLLSVVLALALLLSCAAFSAVAEGTVYTGTWYLNAIMLGDMAVSPALMAMSAQMDLNEDGTGTIVLVMNGTSSTSTLTWVPSETGITVTENEKNAVACDVQEDGSILWDVGEYKMSFSREEPAPVTPPEAVPAESLDAFQGSWRMAFADVNGAMTPKYLFDQLGQNVDAVLVVDGDQASFKLTMTQELPMMMGTLEMTDGAAVLTVTDLQVTDTATINVTITLQTTDTDLMRCQFHVTTSEGDPTVVYLEKVAEEEAAPAA